MLKPISLMVFLSILTVFFHPYLKVGLDYIHLFFQWLYHLTGFIFSTSDMGVLLRKMTVLLLTPWLCVAPVVGLYYLLYRQIIPYLLEAVWVVWIILAVLSMR
jgi:hypothetical protein